MVLIVEANVVCEEVERSIVGVCLGQGDLIGGVGDVLIRLLENVVLGDEVACAGVQRASEEAAHDQVAQRPSSCAVHERIVEGELHDDVEEVNLGEGKIVDEHGAQGVEEDLEGGEKGLAGDRVEEDGFKGGGQVRIQAVDAEGLVVCEVVGPERGAVGDANGQIGKHGEEAVCERVSEGKVVRYLVYGEEQILVRRSTDDVGSEEEGPREYGRVADEVCAEDLDAYDEENDIFGEGLRATELGYLWMGLDDSHSPRPVRLFGVGPEEVVVPMLVLDSRFLLLLRLDCEASACGLLRWHRGGRD